jgi:hypothetical protein
MNDNTTILHSQLSDAPLVGLIQKAWVLVLRQEEARRLGIGIDSAQAHHPRVLNVGVVLLPLLSPLSEPLQLRRAPTILHKEQNRQSSTDNSVTSQYGTSPECREQGARQQEPMQTGPLPSPQSDRGGRPQHALGIRPCAAKYASMRTILRKKMHQLTSI